MSPAVLVTGATGWLGSRLVQALLGGLPDLAGLRPEREAPVRALLLPGESALAAALGDGVRVEVGDLCRPASLAAFFRDARGATLFHCAGLVHPRRRIRELYAANATATRNALQAARAAGVSRFVHVSSNSPFGFNAEPGQLFDESSPYAPYQHYGRSKRLAEEAVRAAHGDGLATVVIRAPWFYGPNAPDRQSLFFSMVRRGLAPLVGSGRNLRSMSYVDNLCQGLLLAARVPAAAGGVYWIADRRPYEMREVIDTIERVLERDFALEVAHRRLRLPGLAAEAARAGDGLLQSIGAYSEKLHVLSEMNKNIACTIALAEKELGYCPAVELEEGVRRSVAWMLENGLEI